VADDTRDEFSVEYQIVHEPYATTVSVGVDTAHVGISVWVRDTRGRDDWTWRCDLTTRVPLADGVQSFVDLWVYAARMASRAGAPASVLDAVGASVMRALAPWAPTTDGAPVVQPGRVPRGRRRGRA
jgi:hypothetical protein